jgi:hypothetical protein
MRRAMILVLAVSTALVAAPGCGESPGVGAGGDDACEGTACTDAAAGDGAEDGAGDGVSDGAEGDGGLDGGRDDVAADGRDDAATCRVRNPCGGCAALPAPIGSECTACEGGTWQCDGLEALVCIGPEGRERMFYPDFDLDGFGGDGQPGRLACAPPGLRWADATDDCDDRRPAVFPGAPELCNGRDDDCDGDVDEGPDDAPECDDACCREGFLCEDARCVVDCDGTRCGADLEICCGAEEICYGETCVDPGDACEFNEDCDEGWFCDTALATCIPRVATTECTYVPPVGEFEPRLACRWTPAGLSEQPERRDVVATPIVINLSDDNGDGVIDQQDVPEIVFLTYDLDVSCCNVAATLRIVSGQCEPDGTMRTLASISSPIMTNDAGIAAGDIVGDDGVPEIVVVGFYGSGGTQPQGTIAFRRDNPEATAWSVAWFNEEYPTQANHTRGGAAISIANLDAAGPPEVIIGNVVLDGATGDLLWDGTAENSGTVGVGNNAFLGPSSAVADIDLDGDLEVLAGNTLYDHEGNAEWTYTYGSSNSPCGGSLRCDGFSAVANLDDDDEGEVVIIREGQVWVLHHDGTLLWRTNIPTLPSAPCANNESGPPTVADFDGDGRAEIGTAAADYYVVADRDCDPAEGPVPAECAQRGILWTVRNRDCSSRATASSVFDFEGDGAAEVVYADEQNFRIFDGRTGALRYDDDTHGSHTRLEMPVIADVDNDGNAEIVIPENGYNGGNPGIDVWEDRSDNWVRTRRVWNQHGYSITNITEGGRVPLYQTPNWLEPRLNNYRQNVQPEDLFDAPNLVVLDLVVTPALCFTDVRFDVRNQGALAVSAGVPIAVVVTEPESSESWGTTVTTTRRLVPGERESFRLTVAGPEGYAAGRDVVVTVSADPEGAVSECDDDDNVVDAETIYACEVKVDEEGAEGE